MARVITREFRDYRSTVSGILDELGLAEKLKEQEKVIIKPNLLQDAPPPCTTDVRCVEVLARYIREKFPNMEIIILEGSGGCETARSYQVLGYKKMAASLDLELMDVDRAGLVKLEDSGARAYREVFLPEIIFDSFLISVPTLKDHSITGVTLSCKNLIGLLPEKYYGKYWS